VAGETFGEFDQVPSSTHDTIGSPQSSSSVRAGCDILVQDHLDPRWLTWFEGWTITNLDNGVVRLSCPQVDPAALHSTLNKIRDLNLTLLSVCRI
jgi:hypothetical protein